MIHVTVEMWPGGDEKRKYPLGHMVIVNDGTSEDPTRGNYQAALAGRTKQVRSAEIVGFPRHRLHVWHLIKRILEDVYGRRTTT